MLLKILLAGDGGQGIQTMAEIISQAVFANDWKITLIPNYGLEQRGGSSLAFIKISDQEIVYPKFSVPNVLLIMSKEAGLRTKQFKVKGVKTIEIDDFKDVLNKKGIKNFSYNVFFLGVITKLLEKEKIVRQEEIYGLLEKKLAKKSNWEENKSAFEAGCKV